MGNPLMFCIATRNVLGGFGPIISPHAVVLLARGGERIRHSLIEDGPVSPILRRG